MPLISLPSGAQVMLHLNHDKYVPHARRATSIKVTIVHRVTETGRVLEDKRHRQRKELMFELGESCSAQSSCSINDNFVKAVGRYLAARRLLQTDLMRGNITDEQKAAGTPVLTSEDRAFIMRKICPEVFTTRNEIEEAVYQRLRKKYEKPDSVQVA